jgi:hypothetical protein
MSLILNFYTFDLLPKLPRFIRVNTVDTLDPGAMDRTSHFCLGASTAGRNIPRLKKSGLEARRTSGYAKGPKLKFS